VVVSVSQLMGTKVLSEQEKIDKESESILEAILDTPILSKVRRADLFKDYMKFKEGFGDDITFDEFLKETQ